MHSVATSICRAPLSGDGNLPCVGGSPTRRYRATDIQLPDGTRLEEIDYERHVVPLITRFGCNAANCHGSFQGRGGFRLSLFGHAGPKDLEALTDRVDRRLPAASLILTKPSLQEKHGGGRRFEVDSWPYQISAGLDRPRGKPCDNLHADSLEEITVSPSTVQFAQSNALRFRSKFKPTSKMDRARR